MLSGQPAVIMPGGVVGHLALTCWITASEESGLKNLCHQYSPKMKSWPYPPGQHHSTSTQVTITWNICCAQTCLHWVVSGDILAKTEILQGEGANHHRQNDVALGWAELWVVLLFDLHCRSLQTMQYLLPGWFYNPCFDVVNVPCDPC